VVVFQRRRLAIRPARALAAGAGSGRQLGGWAALQSTLRQLSARWWKRALAGGSIGTE